MSDLPKTLIFLGPQGSGKGTQAKLLVEKFGYLTFSTGNLLRDIAEQNTEMGRKVKTTIDSGHLVAPELISEVVREKLEKMQSEQPVIIDGYPRSEQQLQHMREILPGVDRDDYKVLFFDISEEETAKRLGLRAEQEGRADDTVEAIKKRLEYFRNETLPMVATIEKEGRVIRVDGMPSVEQIHREVVQKLNLR